MKTNEYLTFTKKERNGIIALLILLLGVIILSRIRKNEPEIADLRMSADEHTDTVVKQDTNAKPVISQQLFHYTRSPAANNHTKKIVGTIEINTADTSAFIALPGIGSKLASRIVTFRERLGGFYDVHQVGEVYGLQDSVFRKLLPSFKCDGSKVRKININTADKEMLKMHPYIRWNIANALITYREQHGVFNSKNDLEKMENIDEESIRRMLPYITFN